MTDERETDTDDRYPPQDPGDQPTGRANDSGRHGQGDHGQRRGPETRSQVDSGGRAGNRGTQHSPRGTGGQRRTGRQPAPAAGRPAQSTTQPWSDKSVTDRYGNAFLVILAALFATAYIPFVNLIRFIPVFKEVVLGAFVVAAFTPITTAKGGVKYALAAGMTAAVVFNLFNIPLQLLIGGLAFAGQGGSDAAAMGSFVAGLGALSNLVGLVFFSPIGYVVGGAVGSQLNG